MCLHLHRIPGKPRTSISVRPSWTFRTTVSISKKALRLVYLKVLGKRQSHRLLSVSFGWEYCTTDRWQITEDLVACFLFHYTNVRCQYTFRVCSHIVRLPNQNGNRYHGILDKQVILRFLECDSIKTWMRCGSRICVREKFCWHRAA